MGVLVIVELEAKAEHATAVRELAETKLLPVTRGYEGCESATMHVNQDDAGGLLFVQRWRTRGHYERYIEWRRGTADLAPLAGLLERPLRVRYFDDVDVRELGSG
jgi:quinol monooxygenase YgiN